MPLLDQIAIVDQVLASHADALGRHGVPYRNHVYRVINLCAAQASLASDQLEKVAIAAVFHDLGIWTDQTFDYLAPSARLANAYLCRNGQRAWTAEIERMILQHHKLSPSPIQADPLVEYFRRADWIDISFGYRRFGVSAETVRQVLARWPNAGFHRYLLHLALRRLLTHPLRPLPMMRL